MKALERTDLENLNFLLRENLPSSVKRNDGLPIGAGGISTIDSENLACNPWRG